MHIIVALLLLLVTSSNQAQEWKNLKTYRKETGNDFLADGCWLKKHRLKNKEDWQLANRFNLIAENGVGKYKTIYQVRDFYRWLDQERIRLGHEIEWFGVTAIVENQFSKSDYGIIRSIIIRNKEVSNFAQEGCFKVFEFSFPQMKKIALSKEVIKGTEAQAWDVNHGTIEQCEILESLYKKLSPGALLKLERIAKRKGIYALAIPKALEFEGNLNDCHDRTEYGLKKIMAWYHQKKR